MIKKDVSSAELEVMKLIWEAEKPVIISDIWKEVKEHKWTYQTVLTFVNRLNMKGFIEIVGKRVRSFMYRPLLSKAEYIVETKGDLLTGENGAGLSDFVKAMYAQGKCGKADLEKLSDTLAELAENKDK